MCSIPGRSHLVWVGKFEFPAVARPADEGLAGLVGEQFQQELPQLDGSTAYNDKKKHKILMSGKAQPLGRKTIHILKENKTFYCKIKPSAATGQDVGRSDSLRVKSCR